MTFRETFEDLLLALDPNETDPEITFENFQSSLKLCIKRLTAAEDPDWLLDLSYEFQNQSHQDLNLSSIAQGKASASQMLIPYLYLISLFISL